ncbi:MAG: glycosyltransferase [Bifidobacteriaceae bacterium]|jgi:cellulose synthase/poly-beta-1,6-N-acetylglucosamine synthase-like glycosyltransferase|nr:glycosyltransferase [Bifidobacteriaceae bacterium]
MILLYFFDALIIFVGAIGIIYQGVCVFVGLFGKPEEFPDADPHKICVLISARNEKNVIGQLIKSIRECDYDQSFVDIWVCADNCTDNTAQICRDLGASVVERENLDLIGKGYALEYMINEMNHKDDDYDAFLVLDADNILDKNYIKEMNKCFSSGYEVITSYRNSKNTSTNWVSAASALWFIKESRLLNNSRMIIGTSCHVGGTGFMFSQRIKTRNNGWKHHLLTEDLEFTMDTVLNGDRIGYCGKAMLYDEQPVTFSQSWRQRLRWSKGFLQVFSKYGHALIRRAIKEGDFSCVDLSLLILPWVFLQIIRLGLGALYIALGIQSVAGQVSSLESMALMTVIGLFLMMIFALITIVAERDKLDISNKEIVVFILSFPLYVLSYMPISFQAIFSKVEWKPIEHGQPSTSLGETSATKPSKKSKKK